MRRTLLTVGSLLFLMESLVSAGTIDIDPSTVGSIAAGGGIFAGLASLFGYGALTFLTMCLYIIPLLIGVVGIILWVIMLIDVIQREEKDFHSTGKDDKMIWLLVLLLTGYIGALIYYLMVYRKYGRAVK